MSSFTNKTSTCCALKDKGFYRNKSSGMTERTLAYCCRELMALTRILKADTFVLRAVALHLTHTVVHRVKNGASYF